MLETLIGLMFQIVILIALTGVAAVMLTMFFGVMRSFVKEFVNGRK